MRIIANICLSSFGCDTVRPKRSDFSQVYFATDEEHESHFNKPTSALETYQNVQEAYQFRHLGHCVCKKRGCISFDLLKICYFSERDTVMQSIFLRRVHRQLPSFVYAKTLRTPRDLKQRYRHFPNEVIHSSHVEPSPTLHNPPSSSRTCHWKGVYDTHRDSIAPIGNDSHRNPRSSRGTLMKATGDLVSRECARPAAPLIQSLM